jgi:hypothetical protein
MRRMILVGIMVAILAIGFAVPAMADTSVNITITAQPAYIVVTQTQTTWTLNGIVGDGVTPRYFIVPSDTYYANPLGDGTPPGSTVAAASCYFDLVTTSSSVNLDLTVNCSDFTGGGAAMTNGSGTPSATAYAGFCWGNGTSYASKVTMLTTGSAAMVSNLAPSASYPWGAEIATRTGAWTTGGNSTATMTITATVHM